MVPLNKLAHILILSEYFLNFDLIIFFTIYKRYIFAPQINKGKNIDSLLLRLILSFLCRFFDIFTLINTIIPFKTFHFGNDNMKLSNKLFILFCLEDWIYMEISILLTKIFLSQSNQQSKVIIVNRKIYLWNENFKVNITKSHMHLLCKQ